MPDDGSTFVNKTAALDAAKVLDAAGNTAWNNWIRLLGDISDANGRAPWGNDEPGKEFNKNYLAGKAPADQILQMMMLLMPKFHTLGQDVTDAINGTVDTDGLISKWFDQKSA